MPNKNPAHPVSAIRFRVQFHDAQRNISKKVLFTREQDAREFYVRIVTSRHIDYAELALVEGVKVREVYASHFTPEPKGEAS